MYVVIYVLQAIKQAFHHMLHNLAFKFYIGSKQLCINNVFDIHDLKETPSSRCKTPFSIINILIRTERNSTNFERSEHVD